MKKLINKSKNMVTNILANISRIEELESLMNAVREGEVCIRLKDNNELVDLTILNDKNAIKICIYDCIYKQRHAIAKVLKKLTGEDDEPEGMGLLVAETTEQSEAEETAPVIVELKETIECTKEMLERDCATGLTVAEMMAKYNKGKSTIYKLLKRYGLSKSAIKEKAGAEAKEESIEANAEEVAEELQEAATAPVEEKTEAPAAEASKKAKKKSKDKKPQKAEEPKQAKKTVGKSGKELEDFVESRRAQVIALYTKGPFSLKKLAIEYSCDNKELHEILARKGLLKPQV